jgi:phosphohistidine phosphatase
MILYFLRHAIALDRDLWKKADAERPLTDDGIDKMKSVARGMKAAGVEFDHLLTSPFRRAHHTAEIVTKVYKNPKVLKVSRSLATDGDPKGLVRHLALDYRSWESILLVGHEPYLSSLISMLVTGSPEADMELKKGGLCRLSADSLTYGKCATLEWWLTPKLLRKLA